MRSSIIRLADDREELRRRHDRFRALIENAADGITVLDRNGLILYEGPSSERLLGYKPEELWGRFHLNYWSKFRGPSHRIRELLKHSKAEHHRRDDEACGLKPTAARQDFLDLKIDRSLLRQSDLSQCIERRGSILTEALLLRRLVELR
jgi:PAS domain-containing protein